MKGYVLVTAAYNEDKLIEQTICSIIAQTVHPLKWVIVSDGSTDRTDEIVKVYISSAPFIQLYRNTEDHPRNFTAQVNAINLGLRQVEGIDYEFAGNLDADITLDPDYFARLLEKFRIDPGLGLGGGTIYEACRDGEFRPRKTNSLQAVAHACQLFRRDCFESIGGSYVPLPYGGPDTYAEVSARMKGWRVASFADLRVLHHRPTNSAEGILRGCFRQGKMDYSLGTLPAFEVLRLLRRVPSKPYAKGAIARCAGFISSYYHREPRSVPEEFLHFLRREQWDRLLRTFGLSSRSRHTAQIPSLNCDIKREEGLRRQ
jgi:poly-beta-1,6-N-acetyl-D-glucosamine synthase